MADREDSIHLRIKIDVDAEDKEFTENLATNLARTDEQQAISKAAGEGATDEETEREIQTLKDEIEEIQIRLKKGVDKKDPEVIKANLQRKQNKLLLKEIQDSPVGMVKDFTQEQAANLRKFTSSPGAFFIQGLGKVLGKL